MRETRQRIHQRGQLRRLLAAGMTDQIDPCGVPPASIEGAARSSRFQRLRAAALPTFRDTPESPSRGCGNSFASPKINNRPSDAEQRRR